MQQKFDISYKTIFKFWLSLLLIFAVTYLCYLAIWPISIVLVSGFLALVLARPAEFFAKHMPKKSRMLGALVVVLIALLVIIAVILTIAPVMLSQSIALLNDLPSLLANLNEQSEILNRFVADHGLHEEYNLIADQILTGAKNLALNMGEISLKFVGSVVSWLTAALITLVFTFYMIVEGPEWNRRFWRIASFKHKAQIKKTTEKMYRAFTVYVSSQVLISGIYAATTAIITLVIALIFGVPPILTVPIAALTFIMMFIPTFGGIICVAVSGILFLLFSPLSALILVAALTVCQQFLANFVAPKIEAKRSQTSALLVLIGAFFGFYLGGVFGGMISTPIIACAAVVLRTYLANKETQATKKA